MKNLIILVILFIIVQSLFSFGHVSEKNDSVKTIISNDLSTTKNIMDNFQSKRTLFEKYDSLFGALLGSLLAALIAIYSINRTNKNNHVLEIKKYNTQKQIMENKYCGILFAIHSSLRIHDKTYDLLGEEIEQYLKLISNNTKIQIESPFSIFHIQFIKSCQLKILDFDKFNTELSSTISYYVFLVDYINENLNLRKIFDTKDLFENDEEFIEGIKEYFKNIKGMIETLKHQREKLKTNIPDEIASFPQNDVNFESLNSKMFKKENK